MRPRIKGRFVSPEEFAAWQASQKGEACGAAAGESSPAALPACPVAAC